MQALDGPPALVVRALDPTGSLFPDHVDVLDVDATLRVLIFSWFSGRAASGTSTGRWVAQTRGEMSTRSASDPRSVASMSAVPPLAKRKVALTASSHFSRGAGHGFMCAAVHSSGSAPPKMTRTADAPYVPRSSVVPPPSEYVNRMSSSGNRNRGNLVMA
ncbi:hypothetical protein PpBr36_08546 [Pyricularia pennisetigena]|uniref:hypothetical protein n=1 Tax=Pyricularia pennisetigena TaxID=1578925 RepID=UPI0011543E34|nr:hypothetical protein PpBr36_08546 [Pyricularia pennisetigena]TLS24862.1 hypothetical protein PpBr36_08546 [Pyricularia pennisetigena]